MRVAVIGAGVAGLVNARVLRDRGWDVVVHEARSDVGGVWSATRGYPNQRAQDDKHSYAYSDFPMPASASEFPAQAEIQAYLAAYARHQDLERLIRFNSTVVSAEWDVAEGTWTLVAEGTNGRTVDVVDRVVLATGVHSTPNPPDFAGVDAFTAGGGRVVDASALSAAPDLLGAHVVVAGFGKTGADVAVGAVERGAALVSVVARTVPWKLPYRIGRMTAGHLMLTRLGEHLIWRPHRTAAGKVLKAVDLPVQLAFRAWLRRAIRLQSGLDARGLLPPGSVRSASHLETHGFGEAVDGGRLRVLGGRRIAAVQARDDGGVAVLDDGSTVRADVVVMATGYDQDLALLDDRTRAALLDDRGRLHLYRHTIAETVPQLAFAGWTLSSRSALVAELQALYIAAHLAGELPAVTPRGRRLHTAVFQLTHAQASRNREPLFSGGLTILEQDGWLVELRRPPALRTLLRELVRPMDPAAYAHLHARPQPATARRADSTAQR